MEKTTSYAGKIMSDIIQTTSDLFLPTCNPLKNKSLQGMLTKGLCLCKSRCCVIAVGVAISRLVGRCHDMKIETSFREYAASFAVPQFDGKTVEGFEISLSAVCSSSPSRGICSFANEVLSGLTSMRYMVQIFRWQFFSNMARYRFSWSA